MRLSADVGVCMNVKVAERSESGTDTLALMMKPWTSCESTRFIASK